MNIIWRRNYKLIVILIGFILILLSIGSVRIIAYNFGSGQKQKIETNPIFNYDNSIDLFDDSIVHELKIEMADGDYQKMIDIYKETGEKKFFPANVIIDGIQVNNVGIRLKGNFSVQQFLGILPESKFNNSINPILKEMQYSIKNIQKLFKDSPPLLIKFDKFIDNQIYQNYTEICLRIGRDKSLLNEPVTFYVHKQFGQIVPQTAYASIQTNDLKPNLYVICESINENYIQKYFPNTNGILYKSKNKVPLDYLGDNPTLYFKKFEQKIGNSNLSPLIGFLKFIKESSDEEFQNKLPQWLELDSFIRMIILDDLLNNNDSFIKSNKNYYLYFNEDNQQFTMLSWDMNLAMAGIKGTISRKIFGIPSLFKKRFFADEHFLELYNSEYERIKKIIYSQDLIIEKVNKLSQVFTKYNVQHSLMEQDEYNIGVEKIKNYFYIGKKEFNKR